VHGRTTPQHLIDAIVGLRRERPSWGARKIIGKLADRQPEVEWPADSTAGEILKRAGLRCTDVRLRVLEALAHPGQPTSLADLRARTHSDNVTLHRTVASFVDAEIVRTPPCDLNTAQGMSISYYVELDNGRVVRSISCVRTNDNAFGVIRLIG